MAVSPRERLDQAALIVDTARVLTAVGAQPVAESQAEVARKLTELLGGNSGNGAAS